MLLLAHSFNVRARKVGLGTDGHKVYVAMLPAEPHVAVVVGRVAWHHESMIERSELSTVLGALWIEAASFMIPDDCLHIDARSIVRIVHPTRFGWLVGLDKSVIP